MAKKKFYVVWEGKKPGIYDSWPECRAQVEQYDSARYKAFETLEEADKAYNEPWKKHIAPARINKTQDAQTPKDLFIKFQNEIDWDSISVDVGTKGNPGEVEYKGVDTKTGTIVFSHAPIRKGTNNLGEFLAIVHALAFLKKAGSTKTVYSDSVNAIQWVRKRQVASTLERDESTEEIWNLVDRAERWLAANRYENKVLKWETSKWGEIKADYGRK